MVKDHKPCAAIAQRQALDKVSNSLKNPWLCRRGNSVQAAVSSWSAD
jgi:hypothetical protein